MEKTTASFGCKNKKDELSQQCLSESPVLKVAGAGCSREQSGKRVEADESVLQVTETASYQKTLLPPAVLNVTTGPKHQLGDITR